MSEQEVLPPRKNRLGYGRRPARRLNVRSKAALQTTEMIIAEATSRGVLPLRVMIDNLEFFHIKAQELTGEIMSRLKSSLQVDEELLKLMNSLVNIRMQAQQCAEGAAPYMHPKLANIMLSDDPDNPTATKNIFVLGDNLDEATKAYLKLVGADE